VKPAVLGCEQSSVILAHENAFSADSWIQSFKVPRREWGNFLIFEAWKCDFAQSWNPSFKGTKFRVNKFSAFSHPENAISADSWNNCFKVPCKDCGEFHIFEAWKCVFTQSRNPRFKGTELRVSKFSVLWHPENDFSADSWNQRFKVSCKESGNFLHFWNPRFKSTEIRVSKFFACTKLGVSQFSAFGTQKILFLLNYETNVSRYLAKGMEIFIIFEAWKCVFTQLWNPRFKVPNFVWANFAHVPSLVWVNFPHFGSLKMRILPTSETHYLGDTYHSSHFLHFEGYNIHFCLFVTKFVWANFPHFGCLKLRFFPIRESNVSRFLAKSEEIVFIFYAWKCDLA